MPARAPVYTNPTPVSSWEGLYVGVHGGYASGDVDISVGGAADPGSPKGGFGGFQLGYNYMLTPNWLVGTEIDASFGDIHDNTSAGTSYKVDKFGTVRGRLGYVQNPWLLYGTAGTAWATPHSIDAGGLIENDRVHVGWTAGLGVEYAFARNWSAKLEYLYADFGDTRRTTPILTTSADLTMNIVRVGLNYRFGNFGDVAPALAIPVKAPPRVAARWTGAYIGVHGGYGSGDLQSTILGLPNNLDPAGGFGGIQTGYNWQFAPNWVLGIETDASWGALKDTGSGDRIEIDTMGTARGRLGYAMNNWLLYGTGGLAWAHFDSTSGGGAATSDQFMLGWTAGAGVEYEFASRWSAKVEYAYTNYGATHENIIALPLSEKLDVHTVKVGLNYHASLLGLLFNR